MGSSSPSACCQVTSAAACAAAACVVLCRVPPHTSSLQPASAHHPASASTSPSLRCFPGILWFKVTERYAMDGRPARFKRRDLRRGAWPPASRAAAPAGACCCCRVLPRLPGSTGLLPPPAAHTPIRPSPAMRRPAHRFCAALPAHRRHPADDRVGRAAGRLWHQPLPPGGPRAAARGHRNGGGWETGGLHRGLPPAGIWRHRRPRCGSGRLGLD